MDSEARMQDVLERLLHDKSAKPSVLPLSLLRAITNDFADDRKIDSGSFGTVYKGVLRNGTVAVKKMNNYLQEDGWQRLEHELSCHMGLKHKNIVRLLGYCVESQSEMMDYRGKMVLAESNKKLLCFEYLRGGNLSAYITDASHGFGWEKQYKIIKGICEGLSYLHQNRTIHLDLKPANICLDEKKLPKILDFSCSKHIEEKQSEVILEGPTGTPGYMAPEIKDNRVATFKADIFSLGALIMEILTGRREYCVVDNVLKSWADRLGTSLEDTRLEQIRVCAEIGMRSLEHDPEKRPDAEHIIEMLAETETMDEFAEPDEMEDFTGPDDEIVSVDEFTPDEQTMELNILEHVVAGSEEPRDLEFSLLQSITENFSEQRKIGVGGCGEVYKGILRHGIIVAVKRLFNSRTINNKMFYREVQNLMEIRHENIVRLLGYCSLTKERMSIFEGKKIMADIRERLLCFEYISKGNLENYLTDELRGLEWPTRYEIIVGICKGLLYLHKEKNIVHMDLKPANILLDDLMVPKITDFGLSRHGNNSQAVTTSRLVSPGYCAPEYFIKGKSSSKSDIYSFGVIVTEMVTGSKKEAALTKVLRRWRHRWIKTSKHTPLCYQQVTKCLLLAQRCIKSNPSERPDIVDIMQELNELNSKDDQFEVISPLEDMLGIEPLEIHFHIRDFEISCSIDLSNDTDGYFAFMTKSRLRHFYIEPNKGIVPPRSKCSVTIKMQAHVDKLPNDHYKKKIAVLSTKVDGAFASMDGAGDVFIGKGPNVIDKVNVMVVFVSDATIRNH